MRIAEENHKQPFFLSKGQKKDLHRSEEQKEKIRTLKARDREREKTEERGVYPMGDG